MFRFFGSIVSEMKQVEWPTAKRLRKDAITVLVASIFFAIFLAIFDWLIQMFLNLFV